MKEEGEKNDDRDRHADKPKQNSATHDVSSDCSADEIPAFDPDGMKKFHAS
jgi:hypothetical protein